MQNTVVPDAGPKLFCLTGLSVGRINPANVTTIRLPS